MDHFTQFPRICIVGAGLSGMCAAMQIIRKLGLKNFTIFDENHDFGGTWLLNTYPNCGCDVPTMYYSYSFEQNPDWTQYFPKQTEILSYLHKLAKKYDLYPNAKFNCQLQSMIWNEVDKTWTVSVLNTVSQDIEEQTFDFVIAGPGPLHVVHIPEEYGNFKGPIFHSAQWDATIDLKDKVVAVVGSGTSAIQVVPGIVKEVKTLYSFQRSPAYIMPKIQMNFSPLTQWMMKHVPLYQKVWRLTTFCFYEASYSVTVKDSIANSLFTWFYKKHLKYQVPSDEKLRNRLTPNYPIGNKRIGVSKLYLPALARDNVHVIRDKVIGTSGDQIITEDGISRKVDVIILATGFRRLTQDYFHPVKIYKGGNDKQDLWRVARENIEHYLGIMMHPFPNMFLLLGPNTSTPYNSLVFQIECEVRWIMRVIKHMMDKKARFVLPTMEAQNKHMLKTMKDMEKMVHGGDTDNWAIDIKRGQNVFAFPGSQIDFWRLLRKVKYADLKIY